MALACPAWRGRRERNVNAVFLSLGDAFSSNRNGDAISPSPFNIKPEIFPSGHFS
jgi:hypothetical protein